MKPAQMSPVDAHFWLNESRLTRNSLLSATSYSPASSDVLLGATDVLNGMIDSRMPSLHTCTKPQYPAQEHGLRVLEEIQ